MSDFCYPQLLVCFAKRVFSAFLTTPQPSKHLCSAPLCPDDEENDDDHGAAETRAMAKLRRPVR